MTAHDACRLGCQSDVQTPIFWVSGLWPASYMHSDHGAASQKMVHVLLLSSEGHSSHSVMFWKVNPCVSGLSQPLKNKTKRELYSASGLLVPLLHSFADSHLCTQSPKQGSGPQRRQAFVKPMQTVRTGFLSPLTHSSPAPLKLQGFERCAVHPGLSSRASALPRPCLF